MHLYLAASIIRAAFSVNFSGPAICAIRSLVHLRELFDRANGKTVVLHVGERGAGQRVDTGCGSAVLRTALRFYSRDTPAIDYRTHASTYEADVERRAVESRATCLQGSVSRGKRE